MACRRRRCRSSAAKPGRYRSGGRNDNAHPLCGGQASYYSFPAKQKLTRQIDRRSAKSQLIRLRTEPKFAGSFHKRHIIVVGPAKGPIFPAKRETPWHVNF